MTAGRSLGTCTFNVGPSLSLFPFPDIILLILLVKITFQIIKFGGGFLAHTCNIFLSNLISYSEYRPSIGGFVITF